MGARVGGTVLKVLGEEENDSQNALDSGEAGGADMCRLRT